MTAKKAATSAKHATATKKHAASAKHTETKAQLAHLHVLHVEHEAHLAHLKATGKSVTVKAKPATPAKATKKAAFAVGDLLPVCSAQALAQSLRLAGQRVSDDEVLELHYRAGGSADVMVSVGEALAAAALFGLAGCRPQEYVNDLRRRQEEAREECGAGYLVPGADGQSAAAQGRQVCERDCPAHGAGCQALKGVHGLILHVDVPGPHAVLATRDGWWSWGELYSPWPARVSEAWAVSWS